MFKRGLVWLMLSGISWGIPTNEPWEFKPDVHIAAPSKTLHEEYGNQNKDCQTFIKNTPEQLVPANPLFFYDVSINFVIAKSNGKPITVDTFPADTFPFWKKRGMYYSPSLNKFYAKGEQLKVELEIRTGVAQLKENFDSGTINQYVYQNGKNKKAPTHIELTKETLKSDDIYLITVEGTKGCFFFKPSFFFMQQYDEK